MMKMMMVVMMISVCRKTVQGLGTTPKPLKNPQKPSKPPKTLKNPKPGGGPLSPGALSLLFAEGLRSGQESFPRAEKSGIYKGYYS